MFAGFDTVALHVNKDVQFRRGEAIQPVKFPVQRASRVSLELVVTYERHKLAS